MPGRTVGSTIIVLLAWHGTLSGQNAKQQRQITEEERTYLGASGSYLKTANAEAMNVARTAAGASNGSSTLSDIKDALSRAKLVENAGFNGDYRGRIKGNIPASFADIAKIIEETHRLFQAAVREELEYWKDQNTEHITSGSLTFKRCAILMNGAIAATTAKTKELKAK